MSAFPGQPPAFRPGDIARLRESVDGNVSAPGDDGCDAGGFNTNVAQQQAALVGARNTADVRKAVDFGAAARIPVAVRATSHGAVAVDGALLIDTRRLSAGRVGGKDRHAARKNPEGCFRWTEEEERRRRESNPCTGLCRPLPKPLGHSAIGACLAGG